jgi:hypothetical protein
MPENKVPEPLRRDKRSHEETVNATPASTPARRDTPDGERKDDKPKKRGQRSVQPA